MEKQVHCSSCRDHCPVSENCPFTWLERMPSSGTRQQLQGRRPLVPEAGSWGRAQWCLGWGVKTIKDSLIFKRLMNIISLKDYIINTWHKNTSSLYKNKMFMFLCANTTRAMAVAPACLACTQLGKKSTQCQPPGLQDRALEVSCLGDKLSSDRIFGSF